MMTTNSRFSTTLKPTGFSKFCFANKINHWMYLLTAFSSPNSAKTLDGFIQPLERDAPTIKHSAHPFSSTYQLRNQPPKRNMHITRWTGKDLITTSLLLQQRRWTCWPKVPMDREDNRDTNPRVTQHWANLRPWISSATSHELKILGTMKSKYERPQPPDKDKTTQKNPQRQIRQSMKKNSSKATECLTYRNTWNPYANQNIYLMKFTSMLCKTDKKQRRQPQPMVKSAMSWTTSSPTFSPKMVKSMDPQSPQNREPTTSEFLKKKSKDNCWASTQTKRAAQTTSEI